MTSNIRTGGLRSTTMSMSSLAFAGINFYTCLKVVASCFGSLVSRAFLSGCFYWLIWTLSGGPAISWRLGFLATTVRRVLAIAFVTRGFGVRRSFGRPITCGSSLSRLAIRRSSGEFLRLWATDAGNSTTLWAVFHVPSSYPLRVTGCSCTF